MTMRAEDVVEVIAALEQAGVKVWVDGGWGVDALLRDQTRVHDDLDVIIGADDVPGLVVVLANLGYTEIRTWPDSPEVSCSKPRTTAASTSTPCASTKR